MQIYYLTAWELRSESLPHWIRIDMLAWLLLPQVLRELSPCPFRLLEVTCLPQFTTLLQTAPIPCSWPFISSSAWNPLVFVITLGNPGKSPHHRTLNLLTASSLLLYLKQRCSSCLSQADTFYSWRAVVIGKGVISEGKQYFKDHDQPFSGSSDLLACFCEFLCLSLKQFF